MKKVLALSAVAGMATAASAQSLSMPTGLEVSPSSPSVTFDVSVSFDAGAYYAWGGYDGTINVSAGSIEVTGPAMSSPDFLVASGNTVVSGQLHFPVAGIFANNANPFGIFEATFTANDFSSSYTVDVTTASNSIQMYNEMGTSAATVLTSGFDELAGSIQVVPAPSSLALVGLGGLVATRRRR